LKVQVLHGAFFKTIFSEQELHMPSVGLIGNNGPFRTGIISLDFTFNGGPYPGIPDILFVMTFFGPAYLETPNVVATTGNPHWTAHPIWVSTQGTGLVVNNKSQSPGNQEFKVFVLAMGSIGPAVANKPDELQAKIRIVSQKEFDELARQAAST
jgi:hypothetical protein